MKLVLTVSALVAILIAVAIQPQHPLPSVLADGSVKGDPTRMLLPVVHRSIGRVSTTTHDVVLTWPAGVDDPDKAVRTLAAFTALRTLSDRLAPNHVPDTAPFLAAHDLLRKSFPKVFSKLAVEQVSGEWSRDTSSSADFVAGLLAWIGLSCFPVQVSDLSLLLRWEGSNAALKPMLLMAHIDVVSLSHTSHHSAMHHCMLPVASA
jgi:hypothetical protein